MRSTVKLVLIIWLATFPGVGGCSFPPAQKAAREDDVAALRTAIERGAPVNARDHDNCTPLHHAAEQGHKECVELLFAKGAEVDPKGALTSRIKFPAVLALASLHAADLTPLHFAAQNAHPEVVQVLIEHGADVNAKATAFYGMTPLLFAATHLQSPDFLKKLGDVDVPHCGGYASRAELHRRAQATIRLLVEKGADVNVVGGKTLGLQPMNPLRQAIVCQDTEIVKLLLEHGANPNVRFSYCGSPADHTPLHFAVDSSWANTDVVKLLLDHGADINAQGTYPSGILALPEKKTPLAVAKNKKVKELLRQYAAKK